MKKPVALGIDIGGTNTTFGFVDEAGQIMEFGTFLTHGNEGIDSYIPRLYKAVDDAFVRIKEDVELLGVGVGAPNANYYKGTIEQPPNLKWGSIVPFADLLNAHFKLPVVITNDANAAALGEMKFGAARGMKNFVMITLGTGLGSGIVVNGQIVYGADGFAGELGHTMVNINGRHCACGKRGCLETYVSATGIKRTVYKLLADYTDYSELRKYSYEELTAEMISEAALRDDKIALEAFEYTGKILGMKLADTVAHLSPEAFILFGGLTRAKDLITKPTLYHMEINLFPIYKNKVKLIQSQLMDKNAAVLGASALIWKELEGK